MKSTKCTTLKVRKFETAKYFPNWIWIDEPFCFNSWMHPRNCLFISVLQLTLNLNIVFVYSHKSINNPSRSCKILLVSNFTLQPHIFTYVCVCTYLLCTCLLRIFCRKSAYLQNFKLYSSTIPYNATLLTVHTIF